MEITKLETREREHTELGDFDIREIKNRKTGGK